MSEDPSPGDGEVRPDSKLGPRLLVAVVLGLVVYAALALWADLDGLGEALARIPWWAPVAACGLSLLNYLVRFPRWQRYVALTGSRVRGWTSLRIYLAGLALTVSPGKVGEAMKSWLLRAEDGTPLAASAPIVLAERLTDLLGFLVLIGLTSHAGDHGWIALATLGLAGAVVTLVGSRRVARAVVGAARGLPVVGPRASQLEETLDSARRLLAPRELPLATLLAAGGWFLECLGCWILARSALPAEAAADASLGLAEVTYAFALSAVAGAVVVVAPGGLGVTEGLLTGLLQGGYREAGLAAEGARATAFSVTLVTRLCTLWFAMAIGLVALQMHRSRRPGAGRP
ncbi:MAG: lysylphosphatidylglycerol synthase transmembrane domain-containing protein [Planctomycetota bacterium]